MKTVPHSTIVYCLLTIVYSLLIISCATLPVVEPTAPPPTETPLPLPAATPAPLSFGRLQNLITEVENAKRNERTALVNRYMVNLKQAPLIDGNQAIFIYRGAGRDIQLIGDLTNWNPEKAIDLNRVSDTDLWWYSAELQPTARLDYQFVVSGQPPIIDPLNPRTTASGFGLMSEIAMPDYIVPTELIATANTLSGTLHEHQIQSEYLGQQRAIFVYEPPGQLVGAKRPSLYVHDGAEAMSLIDMRGLLDRLLTSRDIPPVVTVFIPPIDRTTEYIRNDNYADFVAKELVPFIQEKYDTDPAPNKTTTLGSSLGGLMSLHIGLRHPDTFGLVVSQSGAFTKVDGALLNDVANLPRQPLKIHLIVGTYETDIYGNDDPEGNFLSANRALVATLEEKGYDYKYTEFPQGHSWGLWQANIGDALRFLYR